MGVRSNLGPTLAGIGGLGTTTQLLSGAVSILDGSVGRHGRVRDESVADLSQKRPVWAYLASASRALNKSDY